MKLRQLKSGILVQINGGPWGEVAPLAGRSRETLTEAIAQLEKYKWVTKLEELEHLDLFPSVHFGLESALLTPLESTKVPESALLMGTPHEILSQAAKREQEGYISAKLKVSNLSFIEAARLIDLLSPRFSLRIDVNRAWQTEKAIWFFSQYPKDLFDYIEEPFQNPQDLKYFTHPLAVDESFPYDIPLKQIEQLPTLKALIYKPTMQGGLSKAQPLQTWANARNILLVLSSSFESEAGLMQIASMALRLNPNPPPVGLGTRHFYPPS